MPRVALAWIMLLWLAPIIIVSCQVLAKVMNADAAVPSACIRILASTAVVASANASRVATTIAFVTLTAITAGNSCV